MSSLRFILLRALLIVLIAGIPFLPFISTLSPTICFAVSIALGLVYIVSGVIETRKLSLPAAGYQGKFTYMPFIVISKRILRIAFFTAISLILFFPETRILKLEPMVITIALGEIIFFLVALTGGSYCVALYDESLYIKQEKEFRIFPDEIKHVEYRYDIIYLVMRNRGTFKINPEFTPAGEREQMAKSVVHWLHDHKVMFTAEAENYLTTKHWL